MTTRRALAQRVILGLVLLLTMQGSADARGLVGTALARALQGGGYVLIIRHASAPLTPPTADQADAGNERLERQLDEAGKLASSRMGQAMRELPAPIGEVWSSPAFRARQTVVFAQWPEAASARELGDGGQSMMAVGIDKGARLRGRLALPTKPGTNTVIVTHLTQHHRRLRTGGGGNPRRRDAGLSGRRPGDTRAGRTDQDRRVASSRRGAPLTP